MSAAASASSGAAAVLGPMATRLQATGDHTDRIGSIKAALSVIYCILEILIITRFLLNLIYGLHTAYMYTKS